MIVVTMQQPTAAPSVARRRGEALPVSNRASLVCVSNIATPNANTNIGRRTKHTVKYKLPRYVMRRCSRTHRQWRNVQSASYQCRQILFLVRRFHPRLYHPYRFTISRLQIMSWLMSLWKNIIRVAGRPFVEGACTPLVSLVATTSVRFAIPTDVAKQLKSVLRK